MKYTVFITLEPYLRQWYLHENDHEDPIRVKRGSAESDLLEKLLQPQPKVEGYMPQIHPLPGQVTLQIPCFKSKDIRTYNYLPPKGEIGIHACIRNRFAVALWRDLYTIRNVVRRTDVTISEWMEKNGIEYDDKNWNTIAKILQRKRAVYCKNRLLTTRQSKKRKKRKNSPDFSVDLSTLNSIKHMKQSLPNIIRIGIVPCEDLSPNIMEKHLAQVPVGVFQTPTAIEHYGNATCEAEQEHDNNSYLERTVLQFSTTDDLKQYPPQAFVITDAQNKSWIIGTKEAPYPIVEISKSIEKESNIFAVKVTFTRKKSLIPCSV